MLTAIETRYNGYRFRSRLEARWAVFFDALGVRYEYEPEGFELDNGLRYLPDFWLPEQKYRLEIKPSWGAARTPQVIAYAQQASQIETGEWFHILIGTPEMPIFTVDKDHLYTVSGGYHMEDPRWGDHLFWVECRRCGFIRLAEHGLTSFGHGDCRCESIQRGFEPFGSGSSTPRLARAYEAARSARFEFGR